MEPLKAVHLTLLQASDQNALLPKLQSYLLRSWIAQAEKLVPGLLLSRQPIALVAREAEALRSLLLISAHNRQGTCWRLELQPLTAPFSHSQGQVSRELFKLALLGTHARSKSWVVRCSSGDRDQLALLRELGFQPIRTLRRWRVPLQPRVDGRATWPTGCSWSAIDRHTAPLIWPLDQASTTSHQRQIVDRHPIDLLDQAGVGSGVLLASPRDCSQSDPFVALACLVRQQRSDEAQVFELLREPAWDERLEQAIPALLNQLAECCPQATLVCNQEDAPLTQCLDGMGWPTLDDEILLGRSLWTRQSAPRRLQGTRPLESMLGQLQPQRPPLPTPSLGRH